MNRGVVLTGECGHVTTELDRELLGHGEHPVQITSAQMRCQPSLGQARRDERLCATLEDVDVAALGEWLVKNIEWVLSGAGAVVVAWVLGGFKWLGKAVAGRLRRSTSTPQLRRVREVAIEEFGTRQAILSIRYQQRDIEPRVRDALRRDKMVLVVGSSMAGKTRMCAEVVRGSYRRWFFFHPSPVELVAVFSAQKTSRRRLLPNRTVVWLDDLERFLGMPDLRSDWPDRIVASGSIVVATMRDKEYASFEAIGDLRHHGSRSLQRFRPIRLQADVKELNRLAGTMPTEGDTAGVLRYGLGEYLGGAFLAVQRFDTGSSDHPLGVAMVKAATDWHRVGLENIRLSTLFDLAPHYLPETIRFDHSEQPQDALTWATERVWGVVQLLETVGELEFRTTDYILDHLETGEFGAIPEETWRLAIAIARSPEELLRLAFFSQVAGRANDARALLTRASQSPLPEAASAAWLNLGNLLLEETDSPGAQSAFQHAIDLGDNEASAMAAVELGGLLLAQGDRPRARALCDQALRYRHEFAADGAQFLHGLILMDEGEIEGSIRAFREVMDRADAVRAPRAAVNLGNLLQDRGDVEGAVSAYEYAIDSGEMDAAPKAAFRLGVLLLESGDEPGAQANLRRALESSHPEMAPAAAFNLGVLAGKQGSYRDSRALLQQAFENGDQDLKPIAAHNLGISLSRLGDVEDARVAYETALKFGQSEILAPAAVNLGIFLAQKDEDVEGARKLFEQAASSTDQDAAPKGALQLGILLHRQGDLPSALVAYRQVIDSGHEEVAPQAALIVGDLCMVDGDLLGARRTYQQVTQFKRHELAPVAVWRLAHLVRLDFHDEDSREAFAEAVFGVGIIPVFRYLLREVWRQKLRR